MDLMEMDYHVGDWIDFDQNRNQWRAYVRAVMNLSVPYKSIS